MHLLNSTDVVKVVGLKTQFYRRGCRIDFGRSACYGGPQTKSSLSLEAMHFIHLLGDGWRRNLDGATTLKWRALQHEAAAYTIATICTRFKEAELGLGEQVG